MTADISQTLGTGVYSVEVTGRIPDTSFADGYHDYTVRTTLCRVTSDGSDAAPTKVTANVIEVLKGKDGLTNYQIAVKHGYQGTEEQFAKDIIPKSNYERAKELQGFEGTEEDYLASLKGVNGKDAYQHYLDTTTDNPKLTEAEWADTIGSFANLIHTITYGTEQQ